MSEWAVSDDDPQKYQKIRFFKLLEVAYNMSQDGHYAYAAAAADLASNYYDAVIAGGPDE